MKKKEKIYKEKERLIEKLEKIKNKMEQDDKTTLTEVYLSNTEEQLLENKTIKDDKVSCSWLYKTLLFIITVIYSVGSFFIISLKNSYWNLFVSSLKCRLEINCDKEEFKKRANFYKFFIDQLLREPADLNLIMFWNFIGINLLKSIGIRKTSSIFLIINILILLLTYNIYYGEYDHETCKYNYFKITLLFINWLFMTISFGASTMLAPQKFLDYYTLFDSDIEEENNTNNNTEYQKIEQNILNKEIVTNDTMNINLINDKSSEQIEDKKDKKENIQKVNDKIKKKKYATFFIFGLSVLCGYTGKYGISYGIGYYIQININNYTNSTVYNDTKDINFVIINNYILKSNISDINDTDISNDELYYNAYKYICLIYIGTILISIIFVYSLVLCCFFQDKEKDENKNKIGGCGIWNIVCQICGCTIYFERIYLNGNETENPGNCELCCEFLNNYCNNAICNTFNCRNTQSTNCCCCCKKYNQEHLEKKSQCFCYCYQERSFFFWINNFLINKTQKQIIIIMILYFLSSLSVIGTKKIYENILEKINVFEEKSLIFWSLLGVFSILGFCCQFILPECDSDSKKELDKIKKENRERYKSYLNSLNISVILFILFFCILFGFIHSIMVFRNGMEDAFSNPEKNLIFVASLTNTYIIFLLNFYCLNLAKNPIDLEVLFPQTIMITIYINIFNFMIYIIKLLSNSIYFLFYIQLITSSLLILILFLYKVITSGDGKCPCGEDSKSNDSSFDKNCVN